MSVPSNGHIDERIRRCDEVGYGKVGVHVVRVGYAYRHALVVQHGGPPPFDSLDKIGTFFQTVGKYECESDRNPGASVLWEFNHVDVPLPGELSETAASS